MTHLSIKMTEAQISDRRFKLVFQVEHESVFLRDFLSQQEISKRTLTAIKFGGGNLYVNGHEQDVRFVLKKGDEVTVYFPAEKMSSGLQAEEGSLEVVYEDEALLIVNKQPQQSTMPSQGHRSGTVANYVAGKFIKEKVPATVHIVTRLDFNTSGLLCIAKNRHVHHLLGLQMTAGTFNRQYEAIVEGTVRQDDFSITSKIGRKDGSIIERVTRSDGKNAHTKVKVIKRFSKNNVELTHVALVLLTGRTHQIRVHMQSVGHPLTGDDLYGGSRKLMSRQALHCSTLAFTHPITGENILFNSGVSSDMKELLTEM